MTQPDPDTAGKPPPADGDDLSRLRAARDAALQAAQAAIRDTTRLTRLLTILSDPGPLQLLLDRALSEISEIFSADIVVLLDPSGTGTFFPLAAIGLPEDMIDQPMSGAEHGYVAAAIRSRAPVLTTRANADPKVDRHLRELGAETVVWVPVTGSREASGVLILARCRPVPFEHADADLLMAMAYRIGLALEQAQRSHQLEQIVQTGSEIARHLDESTVCTEAVRMLPTVVRADAAALILTDRGGTPRCAAQFGLDPSWDSTWTELAERLLPDSSTEGIQPYSTSDLRAGAERLSLELPNSCPVRALLALPIRREEKTQGLLYAMRFSTTSFSPDTVQVAMLYAGQTSAALENARLYRAVRDKLAERVRAEQELRESEERLKSALMGADLGMWDWNVATGAVRFNDRWAEMLGYSIDEIEPHASTWQKLIHPDDMAYVMEALNSHLEGRTPHYETEHRCLAKSGEWIWVLDKGKVTNRDDQGHPLRVVGTYLDITEAKQIQAERLLIEQQKYQVWRAESLGRMAGGIAHHFNNLLMAVMGNLELALVAQSRVMNPRSYINEAMKASLRAAEISQLMLAYVGQTTRENEPLDLAEATREAFPLLLPSMPKNIHLKADLPPRGPIILADGVQIKQILTNLVSNAVEAIGQGEGEIVVAVGVKAASEIRASRFFPLDWNPKEGNYVFLSVSDTGCGLEEAIEEKIFDPFFSTKFTGRGLGLSVVLGMVRAHGGAISVESRLGSGAVFRLFFPPAEVVPPTPKEEALIPEVTKGEGLVLVADDDTSILDMSRARLERLGYEVITARDGVEAARKFRTRRDEFRLVILDLTMPRMGGWETLAALRALRSDITVILVSGYDEAQVMHGEHPEKPQLFLHKPYGMKDLEAALRAARKARPDVNEQ